MKGIFSVLAIVFCCLLACPVHAEVDDEYNVRVSFKDFSGYLVHRDNGVVLKFGVCLPKKSLKLPVRGYIIGVERNPWWYPTEATRADYLAKNKIELPKAIPPGDPRNAMGKVKFKLISDELSDATIKIHGTNKPGSIGKRESRGCIRALNESTIQLADQLESDLKSGKKIPFVFDK
jgi:lipoprotein-anchoring transpeptidase ErfK/SrfK